MITVRRCPWAASLAMILDSPGAAGDTPGLNTNSDRIVAAPPCDARPRKQSGELGMREPYQPGN
jgi:hypothetical protein